MARSHSEHDAQAARHRALADPTRLALLEALREPLEVRALAERVGLHQNTVRWHLELLAEAGLVTAERAEASGRGRPRSLYRATPVESAAALEGLRVLCEALAVSLAAAGVEPSPLTEEAGRSWGRYLVRRPPPSRALGGEEAVTELVRLLEALGFDVRAEPAGDGSELLVGPCPFGGLASAHPEVVCPVHLGLMRGALEELRAPLAAAGLEPFVQPGLCRATLVQTNSEGGEDD